MSVDILYQSYKFDRRDRIPIWNDVVWRNYVPLAIQVKPHDNFVGRVMLSWLADVRIVTSGSRAQQITRTAQLIAQDDDDYLMAGLQLKGRSFIEQHQRQARLRPGDFVFWDTRRPYDIYFPNDWEMAVFQFPRRAFSFGDGVAQQLTARVMDGQQGVTGVAGALLGRIAREAKWHNFHHEASLLEHTVGLLTLCSDQFVADKSISYDDVLFRRVRAYIKNNLKDPNLNTSSIAKAHGLSVQRLYRLCQSYQFQIGAFIQQQRLQQVKQVLATPRSRHRTIAAVANEWGFNDVPHFYRLFKREFGVTPGQFRESFE